MEERLRGRLRKRKGQEWRARKKVERRRSETLLSQNEIFKACWPTARKVTIDMAPISATK